MYLEAFKYKFFVIAYVYGVYLSSYCAPLICLGAYFCFAGTMVGHKCISDLKHKLIVSCKNGQNQSKKSCKNGQRCCEKWEKRYLGGVTISLCNLA